MIIIRGAQHPVRMNAIAGKREDDSFSFDDTRPVPEELAGTPVRDGLRYNAGHVAVDHWKHLRGMKLLHWKPAKILPETLGDAVAGQAPREMAGGPIVFEGPYQR